jgi:cytochrome c oxidase subunit IV
VARVEGQHVAHAEGQNVAHAEGLHVAHAEAQPGAHVDGQRVAHVDGQHVAQAEGQPAAHAEGQQHPLGIYFKIWGLLFVLSIASYLVDYFHLQGYLRWSLIIVFMLLKAGLIVAVFMHMLWERLALVYAIIVPPLLLLVLLGIGAFEADYTFLTRGTFFGTTSEAPATHRQVVPER